jgi:3-isopropylmalate dehydratase small subunit
MDGKVVRKIFVLRNAEGKLISDIDTDQIFHNRYLSIVDIEKMGPYTFDNLKGYENFSKIAEKGMVAVAGENFGSGSSRQQAVDCFVALGLYGIAARSFGAIYKRNAINSGFPIIEMTELDEASFVTGNEIEFDFDACVMRMAGKPVGTFRKFSAVQKEIIEKKGLLNCV